MGMPQMQAPIDINVTTPVEPISEKILVGVIVGLIMFLTAYAFKLRKEK